MAPIILLYINFIRKGILYANKKFLVVEGAGIPFSIAIVVITVCFSKNLEICTGNEQS